MGRMHIGGRGGYPMRWVLAVIVLLFSVIGYLSSVQENPITGERQHVQLSPDQEIALGLQAMPEMMQEFGGPYNDPDAQALVDRVGASLLQALQKSTGKELPYPFEFHLLADPKVVNAFALPGGQVFITLALYKRLQTEGQLAGVLGHEIGHVVNRHGAEHLAQQQLTQGIAGAVAVGSGDIDTARLAMAIKALVDLRYSREDELESDQWGVRLMLASGYDPRALIGVMDILEQASGGGGGAPEFMQTHPNPENRRQRIMEEIERQTQGSLPTNLEP